jgi:hypothetical protein
MTIHKFSINRYTFYRGHSFIDELEDNINFKLESCSVFYCQDKLHKYWANEVSLKAKKLGWHILF